MPTTPPTPACRQHVGVLESTQHQAVHIVDITASEVYYCREGEEAVCLIDKVDLALPITVTAGGVAVAVIEYELPQ